MAVARLVGLAEVDEGPSVKGVSSHISTSKSNSSAFPLVSLGFAPGAPSMSKSSSGPDIRSEAEDGGRVGGSESRPEPEGFAGPPSSSELIPSMSNDSSGGAWCREIPLDSSCHTLRATCRWGRREGEKRRLRGNVEPYVHPPAVCQFLNPLNYIVERMSWVHLVGPILVRPNKTIEIRNLIFPMSHKGVF